MTSRLANTHIVDEFLTELTVNTGSDVEVKSAEAHDVDEMKANDSIEKQHIKLNFELNVLNQTGIIIDNPKIDNAQKVKLLEHKIKELVSFASYQRETINKLSSMEAKEEMYFTGSGGEGLLSGKHYMSTDLSNDADCNLSVAAEYDMN